MFSFRSSVAVTQHGLPVLLAITTLVGCNPDAPPPPPPPAAIPTLAPARTSAAADPAVTAPAVVSPPAPAPERPWDFCSSRDPNPWSWRSEAAGMWGEDPAMTPAFALKQERRAPKMPDADRHLKSLAPTTVTDALHDALLICHVETYSRNGLAPTLYQYKLQEPPARARCGSDWDSLNGPDVLLRFRFREEYPIALFGPEDHWGFLVSIPNVSLAVGDTLSVKLWDRDAGTYWNGYVSDEKNEYMGAATMKFDGRLPFTLHSAFFSLRCNAMKSAATHALARSWLAQLDRRLQADKSWRPDTNRWDFGQSDPEESVGSDFGHGIFRYPAGILGWQAPEIQSRLVVVNTLNSEALRKRYERLAELIHKSPPATPGVYPLDGGRGSFHIESAQCRSGECEVRAQVGPAALKDLCTQVSPTPLLSAAGIDDSGKFASAFTELEKDGTWQSCAGEPVAKAGSTTVRIKLLGAPVLLWLGGVGKASLFKLPAPAR